LKRPIPAVTCLIALYSASHVSAWFGEGHGLLSQAAVRALPESMPAYFRAGADVIAHCSWDPDVFKNRGLPNLIDSESPEHYIDFEMLKGRDLPAQRYDYLKMCARHGLDPENIGTLPYAIADWTERLTMAFAEYRRRPSDRAVQMKSLVYAGILAHYAQDLCQPLHTTVHHDGRAVEGAPSPRTGIHGKVDGLAERRGILSTAETTGVTVEPVDALMPAIIRELHASRSLIDRVFELESKLPRANNSDAIAPEVTTFARDRAKASVRFTAALLLTAWVNSAKVQLPEWLRRPE
jgi:hypothetical protein